jgi:CheY-like chemotaxis protein
MPKGSDIMANKEILIIEDDFSIRLSLKELLESEGYAVQMAGNGQEGLAYLSENASLPSLILLDLYMPVMDGKTFLAEFAKQFSKLTDLPLLLMTAAASGEYPKDFDQTKILKKPIDIDELFAKMESLLT